MVSHFVFFKWLTVELRLPFFRNTLYTGVQLTHSALECIKMLSDTINLNYVPKQRDKFLQKMSPHLLQLNVVMTQRNYLGKIICECSTWQHIQLLKITILGANWQHFRLERKAKCSYSQLCLSRIRRSRIIAQVEGLFKSSSLYFLCFLPHISRIFSKSKQFLQSQWIRLRQS